VDIFAALKLLPVFFVVKTIAITSATREAPAIVIIHPGRANTNTAVNAICIRID
jgi:hypothetical protein